MTMKSGYEAGSGPSMSKGSSIFQNLSCLFEVTASVQVLWMT